MLARVLGRRDRKGSRGIVLGLALLLASCTRSPGPFMPALDPKQQAGCTEEQIRVLESRWFAESNSTVYRLDVCGRSAELEAYLVFDVEPLEHGQLELLRESMSAHATPPEQVRQRVAGLVASGCAQQARQALTATPEQQRQLLLDADDAGARYTAQVQSCAEREAEYLGNDEDGPQGRPRYWFALGSSVYHVSSILHRPDCEHSFEDRGCERKKARISPGANRQCCLE